MNYIIALHRKQKEFIRMQAATSNIYIYSLRYRQNEIEEHLNPLTMHSNQSISKREQQTKLAYPIIRLNILMK